MSAHNIYIENLMINNLLSYLIESDHQFNQFPVYIHFINCPFNNVPEFLLKRREIGIVLQKQFEDISVDQRYISVTLYFDGKPNELRIDLSSIFLIEVIGVVKINFDNRVNSRSYLAYLDKEYEKKNYNSKIQQVVNIVLKNTSVAIPNVKKKVDKKHKKCKIVSIDEIIKNNS